MKKRNINKTYFLLMSMALIAVPVQILAQHHETIQSGRPGQAIGPNVVGQHIFQVQSGLDYGENEVQDNEFNSTDFNTMIRFGTSDFFEVNGAFNYSWQEDRINDQEFSSDGVTQTELGVRTNILNSESRFPSLGFQYRIKLPSPSKEFRSKQAASTITLVTGQNIGKVGLTTNWGIDWDGNTGAENGFYVMNLSTNLTDRLGVFVEHYGVALNKDWNGKFDGGFAFLVNNDLQLDLLGGWGSVCVDDSNFFISIGFSWRTRNKDSN